MKFRVLKCILFTLALPLFFSFSQAADAQSSDAKASIYFDNGKLENGRMLIPLRSVSEALESKVIWNQSTKSITITRENTTIFLKINSKQVKVNGEAITIDVPARVYSGTTYVPVRFVSQAFNGKIGWIPSLYEATVELGDTLVRVNSNPGMSRERVMELIDQVNKTTNLSNYPQIRTNFRPYFTDHFINRIVNLDGVKDNRVMVEDFEDASVDYGLKIRQSEFINSETIVERYIHLTVENRQFMVKGVEVEVYPYYP
ncbi:copper amine oxidase N-terminal domain-containing protein [Rossellomorea aquimaris]|uniref:copper amine oxidase N-terminal domain-containing protein n=1 Tax=Rossellomorea aquimaris TaxID=189382 RepID=UPI001CFD5FED|nr:copper amine oxidase N-terminal domain-containing protein [Rossellomorea aquimaris]